MKSHDASTSCTALIPVNAKMQSRHCIIGCSISEELKACVAVDTDRVYKFAGNTFSYSNLVLLPVYPVDTGNSTKFYGDYFYYRHSTAHKTGQPIQGCGFHI